MPDLTKKSVEVDEKTGTVSGFLSYSNAKVPVPNKFATTTELNATRVVGLKEDFPTEIVIAGKLIYPETLKRILKEEEFLKEFARRLARETSSHEDALSMLFFVLKGEAAITESSDLRTALDLQYFADMDVITVQQTPGVSPTDFFALYRFAERWLDNRGIDKPLMPVLTPTVSRDEFEKTLKSLLKREIKALGFDMRGGFYYQALRSIEEAKEKNPELWVHAFQVPPKIRFAHSLLRCSEGMMLPLFGVDSYNRWVVPPPPVPLVKDNINMFDSTNWGVFKRKEWNREYGASLHCTCPMCNKHRLPTFFLGEVLTVLGRSKVHDHYAIREQLLALAGHVKQGNVQNFVSKKKYPSDFLKQTSEAESEPVRASSQPSSSSKPGGRPRSSSANRSTSRPRRPPPSTRSS
ncbi:MAG TPA: hypothetical protein VLV18_06000 [Terriglobales bacterium]|nr:hypothetical protein [Terriglobales bacterium]